MSVPVNPIETYPGQNLSVSQLLNAVKKKLQDTCFARRIVTTMKEAEVDLLERDVLGVLSLVRSTKNTFASINRIPPEVLSLIAHLRDKEDTDENLIALTHVCRSWREIFISHASLWTNLDCTVFDKTRVYLKRSKTSPLDIYLDEEDFLNDAFLLTVPHLNRLGSLFLSGPPDALPRLIKYLGSPSPLLRKLSLSVDGSEEVVLQDTFFGGDLSSLRELRLDGVITNLAWENMSNLGTFVLLNVSAEKISVTQLLNFFERAPLLHSIRLQAALPSSSNAPPGRVVPLPNLKYLIIIALRLHTTLLNHLLVPTGAMITQAFPFTDTKSPILFQLPKDLRNLQNISNVTSISIRFDSGPLLLFEGPSGGHKIICIWKGQGRISTNIGPRVIRSLDAFGVSAVEKLTITHWQFTSPSVAVDKSPIYRILHLMNSLRTLTLTACLNRPFVLALNPKKNPPGMVICPKLKQLIVYAERKKLFCFGELLEMAKERAFRGAKLETVTIMIIGADPFLPVSDVLELKTCVSHVEYSLNNVIPTWDGDVAPRGVTDYEQ